MKKYLLLMLTGWSVLPGFSQTDSLETASDTLAINHARSHASAALSYISNSVYNGRTSSDPIPYLIPRLGYYNKSGFFADLSLSWLAVAGQHRVDLFNIDAGYDFYKGNFDGEIVVSKSFYNQSSENISSAINSSIWASAGYDFGVIKPTVDAGLLFGDKTDYALSPGLEHTFFLAKDKLQITPSVRADLSTQYYYGTYYRRKKAGPKTKNAGIVYDVTQEIEDPGVFKVLDYQGSLLLVYKVGRFSLIASPTWVMPVNPATFKLTLVPETGGNTIIRERVEDISNSFYIFAGVSFKI